MFTLWRPNGRYFVSPLVSGMMLGLAVPVLPNVQGLREMSALELVRSQKNQ
jgi:hypothetical protein